MFLHRVLAVVALVGLPLTAATEVKPITQAVPPLPGAKRDPFDSVSITRNWLYAPLYDTLTFVDRDGKLLPWLAESWRQETPTTWTFKLRPGVKFSDGTPLTAAMVVKTLAYLRADGKTEAAAVFVGNVAGADAPDDATVRVTTRAPDPTLAQKLSLIRIATLPGGKAFSRDAMINEAIGTGPYAIETWSPARVTFRAVPGAWRRAPTDRLIGVSLPDAAARRSAFLGGVVDIAGSIFDFSELADAADKPYVLEEEKVPSVVALGFNTVKDSPLRDVRVRQALSAAVNVKAIVEAMFAGRAALATQPARHEFLGFNPEVSPAGYDPAKAKALLAEAGYAKGFSFSMVLTQGGTVWDQVFQLVANDLAKVGVKMDIRAVPEAVMSEMIGSAGIPDEAFGATYYAPTFDALDAVRQHSCTWQAVWYCDPEADRLRDTALAANDLQGRIAATQKLMARSAAQAQAIFLYESVSTVAHTKRLKNFRSDFSFIRYELMQVTE